MTHDGFIRSQSPQRYSCPYCARFRESGHGQNCSFGILERQRDNAIGEGMCDACGGQGGIDTCMCGGTGRASDAVIYLRKQIQELEASRLRYQEWLTQKSNDKVAALHRVLDLENAASALLNYPPFPIGRGGDVGKWYAGFLKAQDNLRRVVGNQIADDMPPKSGYNDELSEALWGPRLPGSGECVVCLGSGWVGNGPAQMSCPACKGQGTK